jgi:hypothetical protein
MIGSVWQDGSTASMTIEGAVNAGVFRGYILEMDNLSVDQR